MKRVISCVLLMLVLTSNAFALEVPTGTVVQNLNGSQQAIKTFTVSPEQDPAALIEEPFELEGYLYTFADIVKSENPVEEKRIHTEVITVETTKDDLALILEQLKPTIEYDDGRFQGTLALDHTSLNTVAAGYATKNYTVTETKTIGQLDRNDMSYVPATTIKNGRTLSLANVEWQVTGTDLVGEALMPSQYQAVATYSAKASYPTLKAVCEGRELPAYEAAAEFTAQTSGELDNLLSQLGGKPGAVQTLEKLEQAEKTAEDKLAALLEQLRGAPQDDPALSAAVVKAANDAESKRRQADAVNKLVDAGLAQNQAEAGALIARAVSAAAERAEEVQTILGAWSDAPGDMRKTDANAALLERVRDSKTLQDISRYLGRFREIFAQGKRNGYAYGRGEKYALELGNDLSRALTSELAMLAVPETLPLFLRKYQHRQIKQYRRREPVYKGAGDIICCLDESGSTAGDLAAWGKAVALTLLEIAQSEGRKFALVHFSGPGRFQTDVFLPGQSSLEEKLHAAETFLGGGTDFQTPLAEAERLMREGGFENADIAFITDGECSLPETCVEMLQKAQSELRFTVTGILLDEGNAGMDFSLKPFCQNIYRTSELTGDQIVGEIVLDRV